MSAQTAITSGRSKRPYVEVLEEAWALSQAPREPGAPTVISTFAGGGGSSLGYHMAGFRELLAVEWDDNAVQTLRLNFPHLDIYHGDIAKLSVEEVLRRTGLEPGQLDVFDGSPPCQGFSTAGKRDMADDRNQLFREYVRLLRGLRPKVFVMENVSGMVKGKMKLIFVEILRELRASGYRVSARLLNAMHYGVPQSRERMIFVGVREDLGIDPSHPVGINALIKISEIHPSWTHILRSGSPNNWHTTNEVHCSIVKAMGTTSRTGYMSGGHFIRTQDGNERRPTFDEVKPFGSWPEAYAFSGSREEGIERIGNSVPPLLMRAIARHIREAILERANDAGLDPRLA